MISRIVIDFRQPKRTDYKKKCTEVTLYVASWVASYSWDSDHSASRCICSCAWILISAVVPLRCRHRPCRILTSEHEKKKNPNNQTNISLKCDHIIVRERKPSNPPIRHSDEDYVAATTAIAMINTSDIILN